MTAGVLPLEVHAERLLAFCKTTCGPLPEWRGIRVLNTADPRVNYVSGWVLPEELLVPLFDFAHEFNRLLLTGYSWINLSAYGLFRGDLILGIELPREATGIPAGLTSVNYSGPPLNPDRTADWQLILTVK